MSPMNAKNRLRNAAFFVPDPWTSTDITAPPALKALYAAICQAVNDNSRSRLTVRSLKDLLRGFTAYASRDNLAYYAMTRVDLGPRTVAQGNGSRSPARRRIQCRGTRTRPDFATLFVNAAAHIQHHYLFCSSVYSGKSRNPDWYVKPGSDPVYEVYALYDRIIRSVMRGFPDARLMLGTGLHQVPHESVTFYWRLRNHADFLRGIGVEFARVEPRMSRDFVVSFDSEDGARNAQAVLESARADDGIPLFEVDNRGRDIFAMLTYPHDIDARAGFAVGDRNHAGLRDR